MSPIQWVAYSPRRLATVVLGGFVAVGLAVVMLFPDSPPAPPAPRPAPVVELTPGGAKDTAQTFVDRWATLDGRTPEQWLVEVRALTTPELGNQFTPANASRLPGGGSYGDGVIRSFTVERAFVAVPMSGHPPIIVTVVPGPDRLLVADVQPDDGDY